MYSANDKINYLQSVYIYTYILFLCLHLYWVSKYKKTKVTYQIFHIEKVVTLKSFLQELKDCKSQMTDLTNQWYQAIRISPDQSDEDSANTARSSISSIVR